MIPQHAFASRPVQWRRPCHSGRGNRTDPCSQRSDGGGGWGPEDGGDRPGVLAGFLPDAGQHPGGEGGRHQRIPGRAADQVGHMSPNSSLPRQRPSGLDRGQPDELCQQDSAAVRWGQQSHDGDFVPLQRHQISAGWNWSQLTWRASSELMGSQEAERYYWVLLIRLRLGFTSKMIGYWMGRLNEVWVTETGAKGLFTFGSCDW